MIDSIFKTNSKKIFVTASLILFAAIFTIEKINGRFWLNDFKVFYMAADALFNNSKVYGVAFGLDTGFYKYSPVTLLFFVPFTFLNYNAAAIIDFIINAICSIATILLLVQIISQYLFHYKKISYLVLLSIFLCIINHLVRELHLGNTNMILVFLLSLSLKLTLESKPAYSGILLAIVILTKPYFLICLLPFLLFKKYKTIISTLASLILFVLIQFLITGISKSIILYSEWFSAMKEHSNYLSSRHTVFSLLDYYFAIAIPSSYGIILLGLISLLFFVYFWTIGRNENDKDYSEREKSKSLIIYFFMLIAIVPSLLVTDTEHFLFSLPLITILLLDVAGKNNYLWMTLFVILMFLYGGNSSDLLGKYLAGKFEESGLLGISNLIIELSVLILFIKKIKNTSPDKLESIKH